jgi:mono/diheme cytochrome c family protein
MTRHLTKILVALAVVVLATAASAGAAPKKTPELVEKGKASYETNCATCHGPTGKGDGEAGMGLDPKPRNLVADKFKKGAAPAQVFDTVTKGIDGTTMIAFGHLPEDERWAVTYYVLDLRATKGGKAKK